MHLSQDDSCQLVESARTIVTDIMIRQSAGCCSPRSPWTTTHGRGAKREVATTLAYQLSQEGAHRYGPYNQTRMKCKQEGRDAGGWQQGAVLA